MLQKKVIERDHRLELAASEAAAALMEHRWHWTLDESNDRRVSLTAYAQAVGRSVPTIRRDAQGHIALATGKAGTVSEARTQATMSRPRLAAARAVARAEGISLKTARERPETKRVEQAVARGDGTARQVAEAMARDARKRTEGKEPRYVQALKQVDTARVALFRLLTLAHVNEWPTDEAEALKTALAECTSVIELTELALGGELGKKTDWDAALANLTAGQGLTEALIERVRENVAA